MKLRVSCQDTEVGLLSVDASDHFSFQYHQDARAAVSLTLPLRELAYADGECRAFFTNLLPEGAWRSALCRKLGLSEEDAGGLLSAIGRDCAGAIAVHPEPLVKEAHHYQSVAVEELRRWVKKPLERPEIKLEEGMRLSLAGAHARLRGS